MIKPFKLVLLAMLALPLVTLANEAAETLYATDLKIEPFIDARTISNLPAQTTVTVLKRQGGWVNVTPSTGINGWLKMTAIKLTDGTPGLKKSGDSGLGALLNIGRKSRTASNGVMVTTGIRGLSEEELKNAQPNLQALANMDAFASNQSASEKFARQAKLKNQQIDYLKP